MNFEVKWVWVKFLASLLTICEYLGKLLNLWRFPSCKMKYLIIFGGFRGGSDSKVSACNAGDQVWSWVRKIAWRREWQLTPVFLPGEFHGQRSLVGYCPWVVQQRVGHDWTTNAFTFSDCVVVQSLKSSNFWKPTVACFSRNRSFSLLPQEHQSRRSGSSAYIKVGYKSESYMVLGDKSV